MCFIMNRNRAAEPPGTRLDVSDRHDIGEDTSSGNGGACTIALNEHRIFLVTLSGEEHDIV
jgi:hypothetical protein